MGEWPDLVGEWFDLADSEIIARLVQRGVPLDHARSYVRHRDDPEGIQVIDDLLGPR